MAERDDRRGKPRGVERVEPGHHDVRWSVFGLRDDVRDFAVFVALQFKRIAVLGLEFKLGTDDVRNSRSIPIIDELQNLGATVVAYDPVVTENMHEHIPNIEYVESATVALDSADGTLVVTDSPTKA
jgi:UDP-glucose 6-dehydrogenase